MPAKTLSVCIKIKVTASLESGEYDILHNVEQALSANNRWKVAQCDGLFSVCIICDHYIW